ncbi:MAG: DUF3052 domain-containing protein [Cyclobacteriaceae bacterium]|nr:MAG: DUF3052 domain-containing protein [Cyclobacteriaceae bacterium]
MTAGYSDTPLGKKLGLKEGFSIKLVHAPDYYFKLFADLPDNLLINDNPSIKKNLIHLFTKDSKELEKTLSVLREEIFKDGMIWVSWPKKSSKILTDVTEDVVRNIAIKNGLVDIKVCAVDKIWSGLKLVIPVKDRN